MNKKIGLVLGMVSVFGLSLFLWTSVTFAQTNTPSPTTTVTPSPTTVPAGAPATGRAQ